MNENVIQFPPPQQTPPVATPTHRALALNTLLLAGKDGVTVKDLRTRFGWHHGSASSVLSELHRDQMVERLTEKRDGCLLYVLPNQVWGRDTRPYGSSSRTDLLADMAALIESLPTCQHTDHVGMKCRGCRRAVLLARYQPFSN
jgi:hypothetical protein